ncbi:MAG: hypothetical protein WC612_00410 [Bdellovibrionales bacterium]|jgi:hypothetical protein
MSLFFAMLSKLFPLYATMGAGVALSRAFGNLNNTLATIQIYLIMPVVIFTNLMRLDFSADLLLLPFWLGVLCITISAGTNFIARKVGSPYAPLMAQASGAANLGYLGIPVAMIVLPADFLPVYVLTMVGGSLYESTLGYYWIARGRFSPRDAIRSLLRMPFLYAVAAGLGFNLMGIKIPAQWESAARDFLGAYVVLGVLIIGLGLAQKGWPRFHGKLFSALLGIKFLLWPALTVALMAALRFTPLAVPALYEPILLLMSVLPLAANTAALAELLNVYPEEAAGAVALSTLLSMAIVPAYVLLFGFAHG